MGRKIAKVESTKEVVNWIFDVDLGIDLTINNKPKVAFLSGLGRSYYPEDPGFSKFSLVYQLNIEDSPPCTYKPPTLHLHKPISNKGYGIDGLSGPRFAKGLSEGNPSPDKYQRELCPPTLNSHRRKVAPEKDVYSFPPTDPYVVKQQLAVKTVQHRQCHISFGRMKGLSRFAKPPTNKFHTAGVGSYEIATKQPKLYASASFGRSPVVHEYPTDIKCVYEKPELCIECGKSLDVADFYRTRFPIRVPLPETRHVSDLPKNFPMGSARVNLCNVCYYRAMQGRSRNWQKKKLTFLFKKTRSCESIHEHNETPQIIHKTGCKIVRRLQMKEAILSKYFTDCVGESIHREVTI